MSRHMRSFLLLLCLGVLHPSYAASSPEWPVAYIKRGDAYLEQGRYADAIADYQQVISMLPKAVDARIRIGYVYIEQGDPVRGSQYFKDAMLTFHEFAADDFRERLNKNHCHGRVHHMTCPDPHAIYGLELVRQYYYQRFRKYREMPPCCYYGMTDN